MTTEIIESLKRQCPTLTTINLTDAKLRHGSLSELVDCLLEYPNSVTTIWLGGSKKRPTLLGTKVTDEVGLKVARYVATSSTIRELSLIGSQFGEATHMAIASALRVNSSLRFLSLYTNQQMDCVHIDTMFNDALRLNPDRPMFSEWYLKSFVYRNYVDERKDTAKQLGAPSMLLHLDFAGEFPHVKNNKKC